uniref:OSJNBb0058J09.10 protein n=1 Tax=Oryza sativa subsp. japonica TaxID=39947 RepID=Q7XWW9_ORYSJ|nr:OSJNBb0058J09.10 [Oryza sativa Japonica Group]
MAGLCKGKQDGHAQHQHLHHQRDIATSSRITYEYTVGNKLETWDECKTMMRKKFVFSYYKRTLLEKLEHLKQGHLFMLACSVESNVLKNPKEKQAMLVPPINDILQGAQNIHHEEKSNMLGMSSPSLTKEEEKTDAPTISEEGIKGIRLICTGKINNPRRGIRKIIGDSCAQHRYLRRDMRSDQHDDYKEVRNHEKEERDMKEPPIPLFTLKFETPRSSEEDIKGKVNGTEINQGECVVNEVNLSTFHAKVEQPLVEPNASIPLSQVDLLDVPCDKEELCDNASLISMPQLVNEHAISSVSLCVDFKHVIHIANEVEERKLLSSLNTLGYVQFDDFCELDNLKEKLFTKSDLPCPTNAIFHIFGKYNDRGIYLVHRVFICSDLEKHVIANHTTSSFSSFDWMKQVILNGLCEEHHMEKSRTVFREKGEDDVTMATTDTSVAHIMDEQQDIKFESSKCRNPIRPPATLLTSNGRRICIRPSFSARIRLICTGKINNLRRGVSIAKIILNGLYDEHHMEKLRTVFREEGEDDVTMATTDTTIAHIMDEQDDIKIKSSKCWNPIRPPATLLSSIGRRICIQPPFLTRISLICIGKINNSWRGVSITKAQHNVSYGCSRIVNVSPKL